MPDPHIHQLDYSSEPLPWHKRKRVHLGLVIGAVLVLLLWAWWRGSAMWHEMQVAYWKRQCMNYTAPPTQVVYEGDPAKSAEFLHKMRSGFIGLSIVVVGLDLLRWGWKAPSLPRHYTFGGKIGHTGA